MLGPDDIEREYRRLEYRFGWRFITCPEQQIGSAKLLLVTLNPAGRETHGPSWSQELGSAYRIESWREYAPGMAPLQRQVLTMFEFLNLRDDEVFSAHYVPFRSPSWSELPRRQEAEVFAQRLWLSFKPSLRFERIVCIGKDRPGRPIADLFGAEFETALPVGWGAITADRYRLRDGRALIALPHLSRFAIFGRDAGKRSLQQLFQL